MTRNDPLAFYPRMMNPHAQPERAVGQIARDFLLHPRLHPILRDLFGEEPAGVQTMFYFKPAGARGQELHQDNFYLRVKPGTCMAAWLAVDDVDAGNGGMKVVPGSHREDVACPQKADPAVSFTSDYVPVPDGMDGGAVRHEGRRRPVLQRQSLIHGSTPNTSRDRFRRSLIAHYVPRPARKWPTGTSRTRSTARRSRSRRPRAAAPAARRRWQWGRIRLESADETGRLLLGAAFFAAGLPLCPLSRRGCDARHTQRPRSAVNWLRTRFRTADDRVIGADADYPHSVGLGQVA